MAGNLSNKQKKIYLGFLFILWILIISTVYTIKAYDNWYAFIITLLWALIFLLYQNHLGIRIDKKIGAYLGDLPKKDTYKYYIAALLNLLAINLAIGIDVKFVIIVGLSCAYQFYVSYKMMLA